MEFAAVATALIAAVALFVSIWARYDSKLSADAAVRSATAAERAADESKRSSDAAESSVELARTERNRAIERTDVEWDFYVAPEGSVALMNIGTSSAFDVTVVVRVEGVRFDLQRDEVPSDGLLSCDAARVVDKKREDDDRIRRELAREAIFYDPPELDVHIRISWQSELGTPYVRVLET